MTKIEAIKKHGMSAKGRKELMRHLKGRELTMDEAVHARCYDCMSYYADGTVDCRAPECPLYPYMPFRTVKKAKKTLIRKTGVKEKHDKKPARATGKNKPASTSLRLF
jgi:hypothetical protein